MKCSFSRPTRRDETRFASSRINRCLATACRVISSPWHNAPSVWPFLRCSRSSSFLRLASAKARKTASSSIRFHVTDRLPIEDYIGNQMVACQEKKRERPARISSSAAADGAEGKGGQAAEAERREEQVARASRAASYGASPSSIRFFFDRPCETMKCDCRI